MQQADTSMSVRMAWDTDRKKPSTDTRKAWQVRLSKHTIVTEVDEPWMGSLGSAIPTDDQLAPAIF